MARNEKDVNITYGYDYSGTVTQPTVGIVHGTVQVETYRQFQAPEQ